MEDLKPFVFSKPPYWQVARMKNCYSFARFEIIDKRARLVKWAGDLTVITFILSAHFSNEGLPVESAIFLIASIFLAAPIIYMGFFKTGFTIEDN